MSYNPQFALFDSILSFLTPVSMLIIGLLYMFRLGFVFIDALSFNFLLCIQTLENMAIWVDTVFTLSVNH